MSVAAYRDPECQWTVHDLFKRAAHPERVYVGVVWQVGCVCQEWEEGKLQKGGGTCKIKCLSGIRCSRCTYLLMLEGIDCMHVNWRWPCC